MDDDGVALERRTGKELNLGWCAITRTGLRIAHKPTQDEWMALGETLSTLEGGIAWLVGDWLNMGGEFGEAAAQAIDHEQWSAETVRVYQWVCSKVPAENRTMSFAHCQNIAALPPTEQRAWLDKAREGTNGEPWSASRLKAEVNASSQAATALEYLVTVAFDQPAPRDILADEYKRVGRPVFVNERKKKTVKAEL